MIGKTARILVSMALFIVAFFVTLRLGTWCEGILLRTGFNLSDLLFSEGICHCLMVIFCILASGIVALLYYIKTEPSNADYSVSSILSTVYADYYGAPISSMNDLIKRNFGEEEYAGKAEDIEEFMENIQGQIQQINKFINDDRKQEILFIDGAWGSGKTSLLFLALDESRKTNTDKKNYFIYESAFKYVKGLKEFSHDLLYSVKTIVEREDCMIGGYVWEELLANIIESERSSFAKILKNRNKEWVLTTELIRKINDGYRAGCDFSITIIIDDIDRLHGEQILEILSLMSTLRKLYFIKIIILADRGIIIKSLEKANVVESRRFIEKYLPSPVSLRVGSGYELADNIFMARIRRSGNNLSDIDYGDPAFAAVMIRVIANRLSSLTDGSREKTYWLFPYAKEELRFPEGISEQAKIILNIPKILYDKKIINHGVASPEYDYDDTRDDYVVVSRFQDIILRLKENKNKSRGKKNYTYVRHFFDEKVYTDIIEKGLSEAFFSFWDDMGITVRDVMDAIRNVQLSDLSSNKAEQFAQVFNQLFDEDDMIRFYDEKK